MYEFWMVWNPENRLPRVRHSTQCQATNEAERLARENPGYHFYVLRAISASLVERPNITRLLQESHPF